MIKLSLTLKCHIKRTSTWPTTSDTMRQKSHDYKVGQAQGSSRIAPTGSVWFQLYNIFMGWAQ